MTFQLPVYVWQNTYDNTTGVATDLATVKQEAIDAWAERHQSDAHDAELTWRGEPAELAPLLYYTVTHDTRWTGVRIVAQQLTFAADAIKPQDILPWVWTWENDNGLTDGQLYSKLHTAADVAEESYRQRPGNAMARLRWIPAEQGDPSDDPDDKFVLELEANGKRAGWLAHRKSITFEVSPGYAIPDEIRQLFDELAGKIHKDQGSVMRGMRVLLRRHEQIVRAQVAQEDQQ